MDLFFRVGREKAESFTQSRFIGEHGKPLDNNRSDLFKMKDKTTEYAPFARDPTFLKPRRESQQTWKSLLVAKGHLDQMWFAVTC